MRHECGCGAPTKAISDLVSEARAAVEGDPKAGLVAMLTGLGSVSYGELAGERIKLGLMLHDPEEEHDCFSDNTHNSHFYDQVGMMNSTQDNTNALMAPW